MSIKLVERTRIQLSYLSQLARKYLAIPATSTPSERLISDAGNLMTVKRTNLKPNLFEQMLWLKHNVEYLGVMFPHN